MSETLEERMRTKAATCNAVSGLSVNPELINEWADEVKALAATKATTEGALTALVYERDGTLYIKGQTGEKDPRGNGHELHTGQLNVFAVTNAQDVHEAMVGQLVDAETTVAKLEEVNATLTGWQGRNLLKAKVHIQELEEVLRGLVWVAARCHDVLSRDLCPTKTMQGHLHGSITAARKALEGSK